MSFASMPCRHLYAGEGLPVQAVLIRMQIMHIPMRQMDQVKHKNQTGERYKKK
jgi:hypothetical protein